MQIQIDGNAVQEALQKLADAYPDGHVDIWCKLERYGGTPSQRYVAFASACGTSSNVTADSPMAAADTLIAEFNPAETKSRRIAELRAELAKLEPAAEPAVRFEGKAPE